LLQLRVESPIPLSIRTTIMLKLLLPFRDSSEYILGYYLKTGYDHISLQPFMFITLICRPILHYVVYVTETALLKTYESKPLKALIM
jgi:hypothetical protein